MDVQQPGCWHWPEAPAMLKEPRNTWRGRERPVPGFDASVLRNLWRQEMTNGICSIWLYIYIFIYICSQGSVDCKSIPIYTLSESNGYWDSPWLPILLITCKWFICQQAIENSNSYRFYVVCWFLGSQPEEPLEARMSLEIFSQRTTWDRLWVSHNLTIHRY